MTTLPAKSGGAVLGHKERIDRAMQGAGVDRPPFSFWQHFRLPAAEAHAEATLDFHRRYRTDLVKVMNDFPYPKPAGKWYELKPEANPFPQQIRALELIRDGLRGAAYFIETVFNPWRVAQKLSSKEEVRKLKEEKAQALLDALDAITQSEINHARLALAAGAAGVFLSVDGAVAAELSPEDYAKISAPFDKRILEAVSGAKLNVLHLHVEPEYLGLFHGFPAAILNYSQRVSGIPMAEVRRQFGAILAGGIDEMDYRALGLDELRGQWEAASKVAGPKFILTPGCSVPDDSTPEELSRLPRVLGA
jgi:uroporphyrinogen-III decarboxylase